MEIRTYQITCYVCPRCDKRGVFESVAGQVVRHECGWGGMVTAILGTHSFCVDERAATGDPSSAARAVSLHAEVLGVQRGDYDLSPTKAALELLADRNIQEIKEAGGWLAPVYLSGIKPEKRGDGSLRSITQIVSAGSANHDELTAWRLAELRTKGERAEPLILFTDRGAAVLLVKRVDGAIEDVSNELQRRSKK